MFLRKILFLTFLILYEILTFVKAQEYLKDLYPKDIKFNINDELPAVEMPRPISFQRRARSHDIDFEDSLEDESRRQKSQRPTLIDIALEASVREGLNAMKRLYSVVEPDMVKNGHVLQDNHPAALLSKFSAPVVETTRREMAAYATLTAAKAFRKNYELSNDLARQAHTQRVSLRRTALESLCPPRDPPACMPASERYRTHDGTCNNKRRLRWGASQMPFNRFLPPEYGDGVDSTRSSVDGGPLSSSRFVSLLVHGARDGEASLTLMLAQWGQLLDHDLTSTAQPRSINGSVPSCCGNKDFHPSCFPIKVPLDDPWLSPLKVRCLEFLRSAPAQRRDCVLSWREQTNQATSYIDASPIYSSSVKSSDNARVFRNGLLIFGRGNPADDVCQRGAIATHCIRSGDGRSGEQPGLLALHHVWVHEHNHIAMKLSEMNLHWSDEKIYQETRRIIGAMFQHITYREFLPIVLGREVVKLFDLELLSSGYYEGYDPKTNPTVANAFAAAAFRFGHSLVQNSYMRCDRFHNVMNNNVSLHEEFQRGDIGSVGSLHRLIRGMASQRALKRDEFITPELTNHLFQTPGFPFGLDLAAINIQRGRDHGVPPYTHWRVPCGLSPITTWEEFAHVVGPESARRISQAYHSVHDIDLFVGGIAERPVVGGLVGPTFACIIAQQFSNSRKGDRFWYENAGFESSFTPAQLHVIRRVSLASVLCRAVGGGTFQPHIFLPPEFPNNERLPCGAASLGDFDISPWLEQDPFGPLTARPVQQPPPPTFKPQPLPDRIFDIMELETKSPVTSDTPISDNKVGFSNRVPAIETNIKHTPAHLEFVPNAGFQRVKNTTRINDKLDIKQKGTHGHVTKQKPVPHVNSKLDKHNRKGVNRHGIIQTTTRRTIIVNNVPIELRTAAGLDKKTNSKTKNTQTETPLEPRIEDSEFTTELTTDKKEMEDKQNITTDTTTENTGLQKVNTTKQSEKETPDHNLNVEGRIDDLKEHFEETENFKLTNTHLKLQSEQTDDNTDQTSKHTETGNDSELTAGHLKLLTEQSTETNDNLEARTDDIELDEKNYNNLNDSAGKKPTKIPISSRNDTITFSKIDSKQTETNLKTETTDNTATALNLGELENSDRFTSNFEDKTLSLPKGNDDQNTLFTLRPTNVSLHTNDSDIDPMIHTTPSDHKRIQRKITAEHLPINFEQTETVGKTDLEDDLDSDLTINSKPLEHKQKQLELNALKSTQQLLTDSKLKETTLTDLKTDQEHFTGSDIDPLTISTSSNQKQEQSKFNSLETTQQLTTNVEIKEKTLTKTDLGNNIYNTDSLKTLTESDFKGKLDHRNEPSPKPILDSSHLQTDTLKTLTESDLNGKVDHRNDPNPNSALDSLHLLDYKRSQYKLTPLEATEQLQTIDQLTDTTRIGSDLKRNDNHKTGSETEYKRIQLKLTPTTKTEQLSTADKVTDITLTKPKTNDVYKNDFKTSQDQRTSTPSPTIQQLSTNKNLTKTIEIETDLEESNIYKTDFKIKQIQCKFTPTDIMEHLSTSDKLAKPILTETDLKQKDLHSTDHEIGYKRTQDELSPMTTMDQPLKNNRLTEKPSTETELNGNEVHRTHSEIEKLTVDDKVMKPTLTETDLNENKILKTDTEIEDEREQLKLTNLTTMEKLIANDKLTESTRTATYLNGSDIHNTFSGIEHIQEQTKLTPPTTEVQLSSQNKITKRNPTDKDLKRNDFHKTDSEIQPQRVQQKLTIPTRMDQLTANDRIMDLTQTKNYIAENDFDSKRLQRPLTPTTKTKQLPTNFQLMKTFRTETDRKRSDIHKTDFENEHLMTNDKLREIKSSSHVDTMMNLLPLDNERPQGILTDPTNTEELRTNGKLTETTLTEINLRGKDVHKTDSPSDSLIFFTPLVENLACTETLSTNIQTLKGSLTETSTDTHLEKKDDLKNNLHIDSVFGLVSQDYKRLQRTLTAPTKTEQLTANGKLKETTLPKTDLKRNDVHQSDSPNDSLTYLTLEGVQGKLTSPPSIKPLSTNDQTLEGTLTDDSTDTNLERKDDHKIYFDNDSQVHVSFLGHKRVKRKLTETNRKRNDDKRKDFDIDPMIHSTTPEHKRVQRKLTIPTTTEELSKTYLNGTDDHKKNSDIDTVVHPISLTHETVKRKLTIPASTEQLSSNLKLKETTLTETDLKGTDHKYDSDIDPMVQSIPLTNKSVPRKLTVRPTTKPLLSGNIQLKATTSTETDPQATKDHKIDSEIDLMRHSIYISELQTTNDHKIDSDIELKRHSIPLYRKSSQYKTTVPTTTKQLSEATLTKTELKPTNDHQIDSDIDLMKHSIPLYQKSSQRKLTFPITTEQLKDKTKFLALNNIVKTNSSLITLTNRTLTTKSPRPHRTTLRNVELRQYQNRPSFTKPPQKVIVDSLSGDNQYEIEINIRQTNKSPKPIQSTPYVGDYTNGYKTNPYQRYTPNYPPYSPTTTPIYAYYQPIPTQISSLTQNPRTKPPTVIFLNEHEQYRTTTTRQPGFLHSIVSWNSPNKRPLPQSINGEVNDRPGYENVISSPHSTAVVAPDYQNLRPPSQNSDPGSLSSFSQAQLGGGIVQASSSAVSNGNFGSIAGFASANGADSTFSFNIRPKPDKNQITRPESLDGIGSGSYGLAKPQRNPWYGQKPEYLSLPVATNEQISPPYRENSLSPFSTSNSQTYYIRNKTGPQRKESLTLAHSQEFTDYDYTSRTLQPLRNITDSEENEDKDIDYEYDEDFATSPILRKFNQDGYLRPEHMIGTVLKPVDGKTVLVSKNSTLIDVNNQTLDDNYVLPVLNSTRDLPVDLPRPLNTNFSTEFPDSLGKHLNNDIFAEDIEDEEDLGPDETFTLPELKPKRNRNNNRNHEKIAFAPINVLTKPERPDNWVIFDTPKEEPLLPQIPELTMDPLPSGEVPKPFKENSWLDLTKLKRKLALKESSENLRKDHSNIPVNSDKETFDLLETTETFPANSGSTATQTTNLNTETLTDATELHIPLTDLREEAVTNTDDLN